MRCRLKFAQFDEIKCFRLAACSKQNNKWEHYDNACRMIYAIGQTIFTSNTMNRKNNDKKQ